MIGLVLASVVAAASAADAAADAATDADRAVAALLTLQAHRAADPDGRLLLPDDFVVVDVDEAGGRVVVGGSFDLDGVRGELLREDLMGAFDGAGVVGGVFVVDVATGKDFIGDTRGHDLPPTHPRAPTTTKKQKTAALPFGGALLGKRIALSAGHGWLDDNGDGVYATQRSNVQFSGSARGITEDFFTAEVMTNQIIPLLLGMGADVVVVRAPDHDEGPEVVVDASNSNVVDGAFASVAGGVGGTSLQATAEGSGVVHFATATTPRRLRRVAVRFPAVANAAASVVVTVHGAGGDRVFNLDQRSGSGGWQDLGVIALDGVSSVDVEAGPGTGRLAVDAVLVGGGTHESGKPWWQMAAKTYVPERAVNVDAAVAAKNDVTIRPSYAEQIGADAFISVHANASGAGAGSTANGISVYRYSCQDFPDHSSSTSATSCDDPPGSTDLLDEIHQAALASINSDWDPAFNSRGRLVANFGELRDLQDTPGVLVETAFFDNTDAPADRRASDNKALHDPRWREAFATGLVRGLARFFDATADAPPARPTGLFAKNVDGGLLVSWSAVPGASGYKVYRSVVADDAVRAFDGGVVVTGTSVAFTDVNAGDTVGFVVAALNDNGEGFASSAVAAKVGPAQALIVDAYDRRDAFVQDVDNNLSYAFEHAAALKVSVDAFDGIDDDALADVDLADWSFVDVFCGKDSTEHEPVSKDLQSRLRAYVDGGGHVFVSGEEVGYALVDTSSDPADADFFAAVFGAVYVADDAAAYDVDIDGVAASVDDGSGGVYEVVFPDVIAAAAGAEVIGTWPDGTGAATQKGNVIFLATPFEALVPSSTRATVMQAIVNRLALPVVSTGEGEGDVVAEGEGDIVAEGEGDAAEGEGDVVAAEGEGEGRLLPSSVKEGGCGGCAASSSSSASSLLSLLALALLRRRRR